MNPGMSLNQSITAGWGVKSGSMPSTSAAATLAAKKRTRKGIGLNSPGSPGDGANTPVSDGPASEGKERERPAASGEPPRKRRVRREVADDKDKYAPPDARLSQLGGLNKQITQLLEIVALPLLHPEIYTHTGVPRPRGVLLHGVPGGGKTQLVRCLAGDLGLPFITVSAPSIVSGMSGESERALREHFDEAKVGFPEFDSADGRKTPPASSSSTRSTRSRQNARRHSARWSAVSSPSSSPVWTTWRRPTSPSS